MIIVIADDLTGAAELGGLALEYGLNAEVTTAMSPAAKPDMLIIATDTRSLSKDAAEDVMARVSAALDNMRPTLLFKKIDSVLRGHVLAEINIQKSRLKLQKALIVPANPGLGRTVVDGTYLLHGQPLHLSSFSQDPEFPIRASVVTQMLYAKDGDVNVLKAHEAMPETGIVVGEVKDAADLAAWCKKIDTDTLVAGAAEFFTAILRSMGRKPAPQPAFNGALQTPAVMICGSAFHKSRAFTQQMEKNGFPVSYMPETLIKPATPNEELFREWMDDTLFMLAGTGRVAVAVHPAVEESAADALSIRTRMAEAAAFIAGRMQINEWLIEGGSTAAAVIRKLDIDTLYPEAALGPGITRMSVKGREGLYVTLKPGSYEWPLPYLMPQQTKQD
jgi:uncharacterized protein YgbK (DUF1537 family)